MAFLAPLGGALMSGGLSSLFTLGSAAIGAVGAVSSGIAAKNASKYNAKVMENEAVSATNNAAAKATELASRNKQKLAAVRAASGENGLNPEGSVQDVLDTVERQGVLDELTAMNEGTTRAIGLRNSAELEKSKGKNAMTEGVLGGFNSMFDGFSRAYA